MLIVSRDKYGFVNVAVLYKIFYTHTIFTYRVYQPCISSAYMSTTGSLLAEAPFPLYSLS